jgi:hypothetical protein
MRPRDAGDIERDVTSFARSPNGGLIVTGSALTVVHRDLIIALAAQHRLPTVYFQRFLVRSVPVVFMTVVDPPTRVLSSRSF